MHDIFTIHRFVFNLYINSSTHFSIMNSDNVDGIETIVFESDNVERKPWKLFGLEVPRSMILFVVQCTITFFLIVISLIQLMRASTCSERTMWIALLSSSVGYILQAPKL